MDMQYNYQVFDNFINDLWDNLMPFVKENFSIKEGCENTAIAGFSMGGRIALQIGLTMQDTFDFFVIFFSISLRFPLWAVSGFPVAY